MSTNPAVMISTRYSVLLRGSKSWAIGRDKSLDDYRTALFDDARLDLHHHLFTRLTLPSLKAQIPALSATDFRLAISISDELPAHHRAALERETSDIDWVRILRVPAEAENIPHGKHLRDFLAERGEPGPYAHVRLDDDDALTSDFIERIRGYATVENAGRAVSLGRGIMADFDTDSRRFTAFQEMHYPKVAMGLTLIGIYQGDEKRPLPQIYGTGNHVSIDLRVPTIIDSRKIAFLRTMHSLSDTRATRRSDATEKMDLATAREHFPVLANFDS